LGCGTGILGLFAKRLWPTALLSLSDTDPQCADEVAKTFSSNREPLLGVEVHVGDSAERMFQESLSWNLVVSNIYVEVLLALAPRVLARLAPGGAWVLSGILNGPHDQQLRELLERSFLRVKREEITRQRPQLNLDSGLQSNPETWVAYCCEGKK
jgi:ribosomal protein L11 methyltransferase